MLTGVRVFVTSHRAIVWREFEDKSVGIVLEMNLAESVPQDKAQLKHGERIEVTGMTSWMIVNKGRGCGCTSKLKSLGKPAQW